MMVKWMTHRGPPGHHLDKMKGVQDLGHPKCESCDCGKQVRSPSRAMTTKPRPERIGVLKQDKLEPGDGVAVDQFLVR